VRTEPVEHRGDAIEEEEPVRNESKVGVAPCFGDEEARAGLGGGSRRSGEPGDAIPALASVPLGEVQSDRAESASELFAKVAIVASDVLHNGPKRPDSEQSDIKSLKR
jgi:hypothetical protein